MFLDQDKFLGEFDFLRERLRGQSWAIIGASGWVGSNVVEFARRFEVDLHLFGSSSRSQEIAGRSEVIEKYDPHAMSSNRYDFIFDCAFQTREKLLQLPHLVEANLNLNAMTQFLASNGRFETYVYFSSGAALGATETNEPYGSAKALAEESLLEIAYRTGKDIRIQRLWNVTGPHCQKKQEFAFTSLVQSAMQERRIEINSKTFIWRRFADLRQVIGIAIAEPLSEPLDSGGELVEIRQLASLIMQELPYSVEYTDARESQYHSLYFSKSMSYEEKLLDLGVTPRSILDQVRAEIRSYQ